MFQGKTYEDLTGWYDFHARQYDAALGRWFGNDPKAGVMPYNSPYVAMMNNPVSFTDPDVECPKCIAVLVGAAISGASYTVGVALSSGGFNNWSWNQFSKSIAVGAVSGAVTGGVDILSASLMKNVYGAIPGALVKGGLSAAGSGISGGLTNVLLDGNWSAFGPGFTKGALVGGIMGGFSGGMDGVSNAKNSAFERNLIWGGLTESGSEKAFEHFSLMHELYQNGAYNLEFASIYDEPGRKTFGTTTALRPGDHKEIHFARAAQDYPNGVNSTYKLNSNYRMSLKKIEANVIHEKRHILDLHSGIGNKLLKESNYNTNIFRIKLEIRAHQSVLDYGLQRSYNKRAINSYLDLLKILTK